MREEGLNQHARRRTAIDGKSPPGPGDSLGHQTLGDKLINRPRVLFKLDFARGVVLLAAGSSRQLRLGQERRSVTAPSPPHPARDNLLEGVPAPPAFPLTSRRALGGLGKEKPVKEGYGLPALPHVWASPERLPARPKVRMAPFKRATEWRHPWGTVPAVGTQVVRDS